MEAWNCSGCSRDGGLRRGLYCREWATGNRGVRVGELPADALPDRFVVREQPCFGITDVGGVLGNHDAKGSLLLLEAGDGGVPAGLIVHTQGRYGVVDLQFFYGDGSRGPRVTNNPDALAEDKLWFPSPFCGLRVAGRAYRGVVDIAVRSPPWYCRACWAERLCDLEPWFPRGMRPWPGAEDVVKLMQGHPEQNGLPRAFLEEELTARPSEPGFAQKAQCAIMAHGVCIIPGVLSEEDVESWRFACDRVRKKVEEAGRGGKTPGSRGEGRFSFGRAHESRQCLHELEWALRVARYPAVLRVLSRVWGGPGSFRCLGAGGDCVGPRCSKYQRLHSDLGTLNDAELPPQLAVNYALCDITHRNGPTRHLPGTMRRDPRGAPGLREEGPESLLSTLCPVSAGSAIVRDVRAWHGGTPNVTDQHRYLPNVEYEPRSVPLGGDRKRPMPRSVYDSLPPDGRELCGDVVASEPVECGLKNGPSVLRS